MKLHVTNSEGPLVSPYDQSMQALGSMLRAIVHHRGVQAAAALWIVGSAVVWWLADGRLPFDRPAVSHLSFASQMAAPTVTLVEIFLLMVLTVRLTRNRV